MNCRFLCFASTAGLAVAIASLLAQSVAAITVGQVDDFETMTRQNWNPNNFGAPATPLDNSGPAGAGDVSLSVTSATKLVIFNEVQWAGNYTAAGVGSITMDVMNQTATMANTIGFDLELRLGIAKGPFGREGSGDTYLTNYGIIVPNDYQWHSVTFPVAASNFIPSAGNFGETPSAADALTGVTHLRLMHNVSENDFTGFDVFGSGFRVDNIRAMAADNADFDGDVDVDGADFLIWQRGLGVGTNRGTGDADGNGAVNGSDLAIWKSQFISASSLTALNAVPEPSSLALCGLAGLTILYGCQRRTP